MSTFLGLAKRGKSPLRRPTTLTLERLECRVVLTSSAVRLTEAPINHTLAQAQDIGSLDQLPTIQLAGVIGNGPQGAAEVDWARFQLTQPARVRLQLSATQQGPSPILTLYNQATNNFGDPFTPTGYRILAQHHSATGSAIIETNLAPGTYFLAVSGSGNASFHPFLPASGYPGTGGSYLLTAVASAMIQDPSAGPVILGSTPDEGSNGLSPPVLRVSFSKPIEPGTVITDYNVLLLTNPTGDFGDGNDQIVPLATFNYAAEIQELELFPVAPLRAGSYRLVFLGDSQLGFPVADPMGVPLGADLDHPFGQDTTISFRVEESPFAGDDTAETAHELGAIPTNQIIQTSGVIGSDPYYDPYNGLNPSADVNLYHFRVTGTGRYAFQAEVFASRIGSSLDAGLSLFVKDPNTGILTYLIGNNNSNNYASVQDANGFTCFPLINDPVISAALTAGDYYLAVSTNYNTPQPIAGFTPGNNGVFDPNIPYSGQNGFSQGHYVLNLGLRRDDTPPRVLATSLVPNSTYREPPRSIQVRFSEAMNLRQLAALAFDNALEKSVAAVYIQSVDGTRYYPRLEVYDDLTNQATFLMLDGLPAGSYTLHITSAEGLTDLAGNPLTGSLGGEYVVGFNIQGPIRGLVGNPLRWPGYSPDDSGAQPLGVLFPHELASGVTLARTLGAATSVENYTFEILQFQNYSFLVAGDNFPPGIHLDLLNAAGERIRASITEEGRLLTVDLQPGVYTLVVTGWSDEDATQLSYEIILNLHAGLDNPPPLTAGPQPLLLRLAGTDSSPSATPALVLASSGATTAALVTGSSGLAELNLPSGALLGFSYGPGSPSSLSATDGATRTNIGSYTNPALVQIPPSPPTATTAFVGLSHDEANLESKEVVPPRSFSSEIRSLVQSIQDSSFLSGVNTARLVEEIWRKYQERVPGGDSPVPEATPATTIVADQPSPSSGVDKGPSSEELKTSSASFEDAPSPRVPMFSLAITMMVALLVVARRFLLGAGHLGNRPSEVALPKRSL